MPRYYINEFIIDSELPLPLDGSAIPQSELDRVLISVKRQSLKDVPSLLRKLRRQLVYDVGDGFLLEPQLDVALHIDFKGKEVRIDCPEDENRVLIAAAWLLHAVLGASTLMHGGLPLHASGVSLGGQCIALAASSGAGKSTLSSYLIRKGALFGSDDLVAIHKNIAYPSVSQYPKISRELATNRKIPTETLLRANYGTGEDEYYLPIPVSARVLDPQPLAAIFALAPERIGQACGCRSDCGCGGCYACGGALEAESGESVIKTRSLEKEEAARFISQNLHAAWLIDKYMNSRELSARCLAAAEKIPVIELSYTRSFSVLPQLHAHIESILESS